MTQELKGAPGVGTPSNAGGVSDFAETTNLDKFSIADALRLRACISDFLAFCYGDQGRDAGLTNAEKTWLAGAVGKIKYLSDALVYGGGR